jgi:hypothetical protein
MRVRSFPPADASGGRADGDRIVPIGRHPRGDAPAGLLGGCREVRGPARGGTEDRDPAERRRGDQNAFE